MKDNLEDRLNQLREKKSLLDKRAEKVRERSPKTRKANKEFVCSHLKKEHLDAVAKKLGDDRKWCSFFGQNHLIIVCLARCFLSGHARHKKCEKCSKFDDYIEILMKEIEKDESKTTLSLKPEDPGVVRVEVPDGIRGKKAKGRRPR